MNNKTAPNKTTVSKDRTKISQDKMSKSALNTGEIISAEKLKAKDTMSEPELSTNQDKYDLVVEHLDNIATEHFSEGSRVEHKTFGLGTVKTNDRVLVKVLFDTGNRLNFSYDVCVNEAILHETKETNEKGKTISLRELKIMSDKFAEKKIFDKKALKVNQELVQRKTNEIRYYERLAQCYKSLDKYEEAIEICNEILKIDRKNTFASDTLSLYGKGLYQKFQDKTFDGTYRDIGTPPPIITPELEKWINEQKSK